MIKKLTLALFLMCAAITSQAQEKKSGAQLFWDKLKQHAGNAYAGEIVSGEVAEMKGKALVMHVKTVSDTEIKIPFFVGDNKSRTWVLTLKDDRITLKHDHRHEDGSPDKVTMYGGTNSNAGSATTQVFPADQETLDLINYAGTNIWWITLNDTAFTYNLRRIQSNTPITVKFDLTKKIESPGDPWGWKK
ncbi:MAG: hypothetical protein EOO99_03730 [Pedobacter sp.]|nr:MAG: hypothetical protein EOO99_03730 [Pedobacter sp.]